VRANGAYRTSTHKLIHRQREGAHKVPANQIHIPALDTELLTILVDRSDANKCTRHTGKSTTYTIVEEHDDNNNVQLQYFVPRGIEGLVDDLCLGLS